MMKFFHPILLCMVGFVRRNTGSGPTGLACRDLYPDKRVHIGQFPILLSETRPVTDAT